MELSLFVLHYPEEHPKGQNSLYSRNLIVLDGTITYATMK